MAIENLTFKRVLFYGSVEERHGDKVKQFLNILIPRLFSQNYQIITREGTNCLENYPLIWLDNIVLDIACNHRDQNNYPKNRILSIIMANDTQISNHKRIQRHISAFGRFEGYKELLDSVHP